MNLEITQRQKNFIDAMETEVLFGGAAGGGKSFGQLIDSFMFALKYPCSHQLILRRTYPELEKSLIRSSLGLFPEEVYKYNSTHHTGVFKNGSILDFGSCERENDVFKYQSAEYDVIRFDELTHFSFDMYVYLISRVRGVNDYPKQVKSSTNPGGVGHNWVKQRFVDIGAPDTSHVFPNGTRIFIPAKIHDNVFLTKSDPLYEVRLKNLPQKEQKALLYGDWDIFEGQFFEEFNREVHCVKPFVIPPHWQKYVTIDYGMDMLACLFIAVDGENNAFVYKEIYEGRDNSMGENGKGHIVSQAAVRIKEESAGESIYAFLAPPDLWNRNRDSGRSTADIFGEYGIALTKTGNNRVNGWRALREWLKISKGEDGQPTSKLKIFDSAINLIRTLPALQRDRKNSEDTASFPHEITHLPDALRGFAVYFEDNPQEQQEKQDFLSSNFTLGVINLWEQGEEEIVY
ncbi:MAG: terminase family protein [Oscillospiraceae bacterium]